METENMKICSKCKENTHLDLFSERKASKDGKNPKCKSCCKEYGSRRYQKNKTQIAIINKKYYEENSDLVKQRQQAFYRKNKKTKIEYQKKYIKNNKDAVIYYKNQYYNQNKEAIKQYKASWHKKNKKRLSEEKAAKYRVNKKEILQKHKQYQIVNRAIYNASSSKRRAKNIRATPNWLTKSQLDEIKDFYKLAKELQWLCEEPLEVDHIIPLQGTDISGLHVPWNLQILPKSLNAAKSNKV